MNNGSTPSRQFVSKPPQQILSPRNPIRVLDAFGRDSVNVTQNAAPLFRFRENDLRRIRSRAKDARDFGHIFYRVQDIDGIKARAEKDDERMSRA